MGKFNELITVLLEADVTQASTKSDNIARTGRDVIDSLLDAYGGAGDDPAVDDIENEILRNVKYQDALNLPPDSPDRQNAFNKMISHATRILQSKRKSNYKPGYFGKEYLGGKRGDYVKHGELERKFRDILFNFRQGTLLKKTGMVSRGVKNVGKTIGGLVLPKASGSTGVFA